MTHSPTDSTVRGLAGLARRGKLLLSAGAIALAGIAAPGGPARSQTTDELLAFVLGAAAVAVIVRAYDSETRHRQRLRPGVLPDACLERVRLRGRNVDLYHAACLGWYGIDRLPRRCETPLRTNAGPRRYYLAQCLIDANWRPESGRFITRHYWDAPGLAPMPHVPRHATPHRPRDDRGWRGGRDRDYDRGRDWRGRDRDDRGWSGRDRAERSWDGRDRDARDRGEREWTRGEGRRGDRDRDGGQGRNGGGGAAGPGPAAREWTDQGP